MPDSVAVNDGFVDIPGVRLANDISGRRTLHTISEWWPA
jgi:hypothetical protein